MINDTNKQKSKDDSMICRKCDLGREWLLKCIRNSDKAANYTARVEKKEAPIREARAKAQHKNIAQEIPQVDTTTQIRLSRLEHLLGKLAQELGVK
jgi:hypothetical protein